MANIENNPEKNDEQGSDFAKNQKLKSDVYDAIEEQLIKSTEASFKSEGIKTREPKDAKGEQGWNRGVYGDGTTYGTGVKKGQDTVTINRVKGPKATNGFFEKNLSYGGKKMVAEIHVDIDCESETMDFTYQTTEQAAFRGYQDKENGPYMINKKQTFKVDKISDFKKELKKVLDKFADKEAAYFFSTKLGIEDRTEKSINSMVESSNNMKKISLTDIINSNFDDTIDKIMESTKKDKEVEPHHPEVKDANTKGKLLFDDKEKEEDDEDTVDEMTGGPVGGAGVTNSDSAGGYNTSGAFAKGGDFDEELSEDVHSKLQERFEETPYSKRDKKRSLKRENVDGWTTVELDSDDYAPEGMDKNYAMGLHGVDVNSKEEDKLSKGSPKGRGAMKESFDPSKKKFTSLTENEDKGVNKRYIITHQKSADEESNRWKALSNFDKNSTIRLAESCGGEIEDGTSEKMVSREQGEDENMRDFMQRNDGVDHGDEIDGKAVVVVAKPGSLSGAEFKVFEDDYLNENKAFILDMHSGNLVNNPNYKVIKEFFFFDSEFEDSGDSSDSVSDDNFEQDKVIKEYPDGYTWVTTNDGKCSRKDAQEMGHCGHANGHNALFTLRDQKGSPHVTLAWDQMDEKVTTVIGKGNKPPVERYVKYVEDFVDYLNNGEYKSFGDYEAEPLNESVNKKIVLENNSAYIFNKETGQLIRNKNYKINK